LHSGQIESLRAYSRRKWEEAELLRNVSEEDSQSDAQLESNTTERGNLIELYGMRATRNARQELGDDVYDALLFATNKVNRIEIQEVFADSAALSVGLERGDALLSYDGKRIFALEELKSAIQGSAGASSVRIEVERAGRRMSFSVPSGRIGVWVTEQIRRPSR
jgi:predicted metalloprotease with PDZ domain